ncbi:MAG: YkgJ family cysteine cluster protein [Phycisphaeraceae bacterium]|nr:MAG: YkgJ family cysteine cluster protein [Phycisphaeraceae bacterium]
MEESAQTWVDAAQRAKVVDALEGVYAEIAEAVNERGPACWASGRCCNFERAGHRLYVTGLEAAYTALRAGFTDLTIDGEGCPYQESNLCGVHAIRPLGCRVYFCDRSSGDWQNELSERMLGEIRAIHDEHGVPYHYGEWRSLLKEIVPLLPDS